MNDRGGRAETQDLVIGSLLMRVVAMVIDSVILIVVGLIVAAALGDPAVESRFTYAVVVLVVASYHIGFLIAKSATPGKMLMGLYVGDRQGNLLTPDKAILRYIVFFIGGAVLAVGTLISIVLVIFDGRRRAVHDRIAGTLVLRVPESPERRRELELERERMKQQREDGGRDEERFPRL